MSILVIVVQLFALLFAITIHEAAHSWAAMKKGDLTAYSMGRVTLNPVAHIDLFGTIIVPVLLVLMRMPVFGWAKPVPVNAFNLKNPRRDNLWISFAGPAANFTAAGSCLLLIIALKSISPGVRVFLDGLYTYLATGSSPSLAPALKPVGGLVLILFYGALVNIYLAVFNMIPVPPLDGSGVLMGLLPPEAAHKYDKIRPYGFLIVIGLIYLGVLGFIIRPVLYVIFRLVFV
ncbi:MAG: site-2 protease family protein [Candidatus Aminicenantes bacterium]|nr:site-2 protease family protein [Candidatus Aminicenantes bacterium]